MTEHEKIFAGKMFNARGAELKAVKHKAHNLTIPGVRKSSMKCSVHTAKT